jgi:4-aminobutyrate aminotransferase-like enzyme
MTLGHAYHGHTNSVVDISPYKFLGGGGAGLPDHVRVAELPDAYRGAHTGAGAGAAYAADFARALGDLDHDRLGHLVRVNRAGQNLAAALDSVFAHLTHIRTLLVPN